MQNRAKFRAPHSIDNVRTSLLCPHKSSLICVFNDHLLVENDHLSNSIKENCNR